MIAIIGSSGLFPGSSTKEAFWDNLMQQKDLTGIATKEDFGAEPELFFQSEKGIVDKCYSLRGGYIRDFVFDPSGKGKRGVKPFLKASEKYGYVIVCSNNSKNGPYNINFDIFNNLYSHITSTIKIERNEMYLSGFSGGSRLACAVASITDLFTGVIACGAGFPQIPEYVPSTQKYNYVGLCGNRDFNYYEMIKNKSFLNKINFNNTLITSKKKHSWPSNDDILRAFDWLYLRKLKIVTFKNNQKDILKLYNQEYIKIKKHILHNF